MRPLEPLLPGETRTEYLDRLERQDKDPANQNCVDVVSLVRQIVLDTLKSSAPGISEMMRDAIATSIVIKLQGHLFPSRGASSVPSQHSQSSAVDK